MVKQWPRSAWRLHACDAALIGLTALVVAGCARPGPVTIPVYGKVTYRGKAVSEGRIVFMPAAETAVGRPVVAHLEKDGSYRLASFRPGDGAVPGEYVVVVESYTGGPTPEEPRRPKQWFIPERYGDMTTSGLKASIPEKASRAMELNFALED